MKIIKPHYYAFFSVEGGINLKTPMKFSNQDFARRGVRKETQVHLPEGGNATWSVHLPDGTAIIAGGWRNGVQYRTPDSDLHLYNRPEIE